MAAIDTAVVTLHLVFAGLWAGGVAFMAFGVLPAAREGTVDPDGLARMAGRLTTLSRAGAVVLLLTGGYLAGELYTVASLVGTVPGNLVVAMVVLWLVLAGLVETGARRLVDGEDGGARLLRAGAAVGVLLLAIGGVLAA